MRNGFGDFRDLGYVAMEGVFLGDFGDLGYVVMKREFMKLTLKKYSNLSFFFIFVENRKNNYGYINLNLA